MIVVQLPASPKGRYFGWEKDLCEQPRIGGGWQKVAGLFFVGCFRGDGL